MKRIILLLLMVASISAQAQITPLGGKKTTVENLGGFRSDSTLGIPKAYPVTNFTTLDSLGRIWMNGQYPYYHNGTTRNRFASTDFVDSSIANISHIYIYKASAVNAVLVGNYSVGSTIAGKGRFIVTNINYIYASFSGTVVVAPVISVGFTPTTYVDNLGPTTLPSAPTVNTASLNSASNKLTIPESTPIIARISTGATFSADGTYSVDVYVQGYYEQL